MGTATPGFPPIVLLVEDDPGDQELVQCAIARAKVQCDLRVLRGGEEALDNLERRNAYGTAGTAPRPDLVLLD